MLTDDLDAALHTLYRPAEADAELLGRMRSRLDAASGAAPTATAGIPRPDISRPVGARVVAGHRPRTWRRPALLVAAVVLLVGTGLLIPTWIGRPALSAAVAAELNRAADGAASTPDTLAPGTFRYLDTHAWYLNTTVAAGGSMYSVLVESRRQQWIPARWEDDWMERRGTTGAAVFVAGDERAARAAGALSEPATSEPDLVGPCQDYFTNLCTGTEGYWAVPTREWIAALPDDPAGMLDRLASDATGRGRSDEAEMLVLATDALRTGLLPASTRATLYRAMAMIPGVEITDDRANLDGETGTAFAIRGDDNLDETIIDTTTGTFIGERQTALGGEDDGTVTGYTAIRTAVVSTLGAS